MLDKQCAALDNRNLNNIPSKKPLWFSKDLFAYLAGSYAFILETTPPQIKSKWGTLVNVTKMLSRAPQYNGVTDGLWVLPCHIS